MDMNQNFGGIYQPMGTGYQWNGMQPQSKRMNVLTADEIQQLMKVENKFSLALTTTEKMKAACTHMKADGTGDALVQDPSTGNCTCQICGYTFRPLDPATANEEFLQAAVDTIVDILQTIKLIWIDGSASTIREYYQSLPLIEKIPKLYEIAAKNFANHENSNAWGYAATKNLGTLQMFGMLSGILNGAGQPNGVQFGQQMYQQPVYQQPMGFGQQPMMGGMPQGNPFGSVNPAQYQAHTSGFAYDPTQVQPQVVIDPNTQTQQPVAEQTVTDGAETTTTATFKA